MTTPLTPEQATTLVAAILNGPAAERPVALFNLITALTDEEQTANEKRDFTQEALKSSFASTYYFDLVVDHARKHGLSDELDLKTPLAA